MMTCLKISITIILACFSILSFAQQTRIDTTYFDVHEQSVKKDTTFYYYAINVSEGDTYTSNAFYASNHKPRYTESSALREGLRRREYFFESGTLMATTQMKSGSIKGPVSVFYEDGKPMAELEFPDSVGALGEPRLKFINCWDSLGNQFIIKGNGSGELKFRLLYGVLYSGKGQIVNGYKNGPWEGVDDQSIYKDVYKNGVLVRGESIYKGETYTYTKVGEQATPVGGLLSFYQYISRTMTYPMRARRRGIEGKVYVEFVVNKDGTLSNVKTVKGIDPQCNSEAERAIANSPNWNPGYYRGRPVKVRYVLPLTFKLG